VRPSDSSTHMEESSKRTDLAEMLMPHPAARVGWHSRRVDVNVASCVEDIASAASAEPEGVPQDGEQRAGGGLVELKALADLAGRVRARRGRPEKIAASPSPSSR